MKVGMYNGNKNVWVEERDVPEIGEGEILLKVMASGICGSDLMESHRKKDKPYVLGHEIAGEIVEVGDNVKNYEIGDRIFVTHHVPCDNCRECKRGYKTQCDDFRKINNFSPGGFSEYVKVGGRSLKTGAIKLPDEVSYEQASFIEPLGTAVEGFREFCGDVGFNGDSVLVLGAGIAGLLNIQLARCKMAGRIIASDINEYRLNKAKELGANAGINAKELNPDSLRDVNDGRLADRIIIATSAKEATEQAFKLYGAGSSILFFATPHEKVESDWYKYWRDVSAIKMTYGATPQSNYAAFGYIEDGLINVSKMITHRFSLDDIAEGFKVASGGEDCLKVIIKPHGDFRMSDYKFEHVGITVNNLDETAKWYKENLGFEEVSRGDKPALRLKSCKMKLGDFCLEILEPYAPNRSIEKKNETLDELLKKPGLNHLAFYVCVKDINFSYNELKSRGVEVASEIQDSGYFFCRDNNGIALEIREKKK